jgi:PTH1 family peptidyl-tRNA hydrolase
MRDSSILLVVGLGNPGRKYEQTRHNVGFEVLDELARRNATSGPRQGFRGQYADAVIEGRRVVLLWPHTYMNRSGQSVVEARDFYKLANNELLIVCDDMNLPLGQLRFRARGSAGGQKGLDDVIRALGTNEFSRLRIGVDRPPDRWDPADYVLARFTREQREVIDPQLVAAADAAQQWVVHGIAHCMNRYN